MTTKNLGLVKSLHVGTTPPTNTNMVWRDTNTGVNKHKEYDPSLSAWVNLGSVNFESGSWSPIPSIGGSIPQGSGAIGNYSVIGNLVHCFASISMDNWGNALSGNIAVGGLPYYVDGDSYSVRVFDCDNFVTNNPSFGRIVDNTKLVTLYREQEGVSPSVMTDSNLSEDTTTFKIEVIYKKHS